MSPLREEEPVSQCTAALALCLLCARGGGSASAEPEHTGAPLPACPGCALSIHPALPREVPAVPAWPQGTCPPAPWSPRHWHCPLPGRAAKQQLLSGSRRPSHLAALPRSDPCSRRCRQPRRELQLLGLRSPERSSPGQPLRARLVRLHRRETTKAHEELEEVTVRSTQDHRAPPAFSASGSLTFGGTSLILRVPVSDPACTQPPHPGLAPVLNIFLHFMALRGF